MYQIIGNNKIGDNVNFSISELGIVVVRGLVSLSSLFLIAKLLGKKQVSELSLFDYVIGISIGNFAAEITINLEASLIYGIVSVLEFGLLAYFISIVTMKSIKLRRFFIGVPTVIIEKGKIIESGLKKVHFDINDLLEECRSNGYFDISQIDYAVMECSGKLSILPKFIDKPVTIKDLNLKQIDQSLCANIIIDGKIMENNLSNMNKKIEWLNQQLKIKGYNLDEILLATLDRNEKLEFYFKKISSNEKGLLE